MGEVKHIIIKDDKWHDIKVELPATTTDVEFINNSGEVVTNGQIFIDMSGADAALKTDIGYTWDSIEKYKYWRFKQ